MENNLHIAPLHWGYNTTITQNHWASPQTRSQKRALSESDCDEIYSEESSKEQISPGETGSCQLLSRKKRRGVIEKKRRDRINSSLSELKRLVPSAYEKQGSAKLEKAEILQLTVEHLKSLHSKDSITYDAQRVAMDYHIIGFRECAAEVARYLVTIEGMDIQDPLRLRLMSHLQYFAQQREISLKSSGNPPWVATSYQPNSPATTYQSFVTHSSGNSYVANTMTPIEKYPSVTSSASTIHQQENVIISTETANSNVVSANENVALLSHSLPSHQQQSLQRQQTQSHAPHPQHQLTQPQNHDLNQNNPQHYSPNHNDEQQRATYIELTSSSHRNTSAPSNLNYETSAEYHANATQVYNSNETSLNYPTANGSKPYRPWGAEMAY